VLEPYRRSGAGTRLLRAATLPAAAANSESAPRARRAGPAARWAPWSGDPMRMKPRARASHGTISCLSVTPYVEPAVG
jgi:hypothetical protein